MWCRLIKLTCLEFATSDVYRALRLLADTATGGAIKSLAREGGLQSTFWAGPANVSSRMRSGEVAIQGTHKKGPARMRLGFAGEDFGYAISLGLPPPGNPGPTAFSLDPEIRRECIWAGESYRAASCLVDRKGAVVKVRSGGSWEVVSQHMPTFDSMYSHIGDLKETPEIVHLREDIRAWRFYDHFRADSQAPSRLWVPFVASGLEIIGTNLFPLAVLASYVRTEGLSRLLAQSPAE